jgi:hypothetical protein
VNVETANRARKYRKTRGEAAHERETHVERSGARGTGKRGEVRLLTREVPVQSGPVVGSLAGQPGPAGGVEHAKVHGPQAMARDADHSERDQRGQAGRHRERGGPPPDRGLHNRLIA